MRTADAAPRHRLLAVVVGTAVAGSLLTGCTLSQSGAVAGACHDVAMAATFEREASTASSPADRRGLQARAERRLELAEAQAAEAAGSNTDWQALQATLNEAGRVSIAAVLPAARADCASAAGDG